MPDSRTGAEHDPERPELAIVADRLLSPVLLVDSQARIAYANPAASLILRQERHWLIGRDLVEMVHPADRGRVRRAWRELARRTPASISGTNRMRAQAQMGWRLIEWTADNVIDVPELAGILVALRDITEQEAERRALAAVAHADPLTRLPNRRRVTDEVTRILAGDDDLVVVFIGIDRFATINDSLGHESGDRVLQLVARKVRATVPRRMMVGRFNDHGLVLVASGAAAAEAISVAWQLIDRIREPLFVAGHELGLSLSVGTARRDASSTVETLYSEAGLALRRAKELGGGRVESFEPQLREAATERLHIEADLRQAIATGGLSLALQPIVRLSDRAPVAAEALVRWTRHGVEMEPTTFIDIAEATGLIVPLGRWVIDEAVRHLAEAPGAQISINLSARELASPQQIDWAGRVMAERGVHPGAVAFEITETLLMTNLEHALEMMARLRRMGSRVGLDDFGAGYSSLGYVRRLPLDFIKLDRKLIEDVDTDSQARAIVGAVIAMAAALDIDVIAEGIERPAQADVLANLGAAFGQGYLFSPAVLLERRQPSRGQLEQREVAKKNSAAVELGRRGGLAGGPARAKALDPERRSQIARLAARARWKRR